MTTRNLHIVYLSLLTVSLLGHFIPKEEAIDESRSPASLDSKMIGNLEKVQIGENKDLEFFAKIDSGAETSSIHAKNIETFTKNENGKEVLYVSFESVDEHNRTQTFVRPVVKIDDVKSSLGRSRRYFIQEKIWIGDDVYFVNVNLADRSHLKRKFLIGKNVLNDRYVIDTSSAMLASP